MNAFDTVENPDAVVVVGAVVVGASVVGAPVGAVVGAPVGAVVGSPVGPVGMKGSRQSIFSSSFRHDGSATIPANVHPFKLSAFYLLNCHTKRRYKSILKYVYKTMCTYVYYMVYRASDSFGENCFEFIIVCPRSVKEFLYVSAQLRPVDRFTVNRCDSPVQTQFFKSNVQNQTAH